MQGCFPKPLKDDDDDDDSDLSEHSERSDHRKPLRSPDGGRSAQYEAALRNIRAHTLKDFQHLRVLAMRRRSLVRKAGLNDYLRLWLAVELNELSNLFDERALRRLLTAENVETTAPDGESIFHLAAQKGNVEVLRAALHAAPPLQRLALINARTLISEPPLLMAAANDHRDAVALLLNSGADVNGVNSSGETALYLACYHGYRDVVRELIRHPNVDVDRLSEESASAYGVCLIRRHTDLAKLVRWRSKWPHFRLLWLARRKNSLPACPLSSAPDTFLRQVISLIINAEVLALSSVRR